MFPGLLNAAKWAIVIVVGAMLLLPILVVGLVVFFWSRQRPMEVSEEAPVPHILPRIEHPSAAPGV